MNKRKPKDESIAQTDWRRALIDMDTTLKTAQTQVRHLERVVRNIRARIEAA